MKLKIEEIPMDKSRIQEERVLASGEMIFFLPVGEIRMVVEDWVNKGLSFHVSSIYAIDNEDTMELHYYFLLRDTNHRFILAERMNADNLHTKSISDLTGTIFYEAEATEMYGITFEGNQVSEVFLPEGWNKGYPMRKNWSDVQ